MHDDDEAYYRRRPATEIDQVRSSPDAPIAAVHQVLADACLDRKAHRSVIRNAVY